MSLLNKHLFRNTSDDRYATLFYAIYDSDAKTLTYTNAGHLAPIFHARRIGPGARSRWNRRRNV